MRPRVLMVHLNFLSAEQPGNRRALGIARAMSAAGWRIEIVTGNVGYLGGQASSGERVSIEELDSNIRVHRLPVSRAGNFAEHRIKTYLSFSWRALRYCLALGRFDLVYGTTPPLPQLAVSLAITALHRAPLILEIRDLWPHNLIEAGLLRPSKALIPVYALECMAYRTASAVISVTPAWKPFFDKLNLDFHTVPTGAIEYVWTERDHADAAALRQELGVSDRTLILYAGSFNEIYGIPCVAAAALQSVRENSDLVWLFVGEGRDRPHLEAAAARADRIHLRKPVGSDRLRALYLAADAAVVPLASLRSLAAAVPGKLLDTHAAGLPILGADSGITGEVIRLSKGGWLYSTSDSSHLAETAQTVAAMSEADRRAMGERGRKWVAKHLDSAACAAQVKAVAAELLSDPSSRPRRMDIVRAGAAGLLDSLLGRSTQAFEEFVDSHAQDSGRALSKWLKQWSTRHREQ